jgi:hypothetical protein
MSIDFSWICRTQVIWKSGKVMNGCKGSVPAEEVKIGAAERIQIKPLRFPSRITEQAEHGMIQVESVNEENSTIHNQIKILRIVTRRWPASFHSPGMNHIYCVQNEPFLSTSRLNFSNLRNLGAKILRSKALENSLAAPTSLPWARYCRSHDLYLLYSPMGKFFHPFPVRFFPIRPRSAASASIVPIWCDRRLEPRSRYSFLGTTKSA